MQRPLAINVLDFVIGFSFNPKFVDFGGDAAVQDQEVVGTLAWGYAPVEVSGEQCLGQASFLEVEEEIFFAQGLPASSCQLGILFLIKGEDFPEETFSQCLEEALLLG